MRFGRKKIVLETEGGAHMEKRMTKWEREEWFQSLMKELQMKQIAKINPKLMEKY